MKMPYKQSTTYLAVPNKNRDKHDVSISSFDYTNEENIIKSKTKKPLRKTSQSLFADNSELMQKQ